MDNLRPLRQSETLGIITAIKGVTIVLLLAGEYIVDLSPDVFFVMFFIKEFITFMLFLTRMLFCFIYVSWQSDVSMFVFKSRTIYFLLIGRTIFFFLNAYYVRWAYHLECQPKQKYRICGLCSVFYISKTVVEILFCLYSVQYMPIYSTGI